jgi:hypothetical protein
LGHPVKKWWALTGRQLLRGERYGHREQHGDKRYGDKHCDGAASAKQHRQLRKNQVDTQKSVSLPTRLF